MTSVISSMIGSSESEILREIGLTGCSCFSEEEDDDEDDELVVVDEYVDE